METLYQDIGKRISSLRKLHHITQETLAERMNLSTKHISAVERGVSSLSLEKMIEICGILDCSLDYLILGKELGNDSAPLPNFVLDILGSGDKNEIELLLEYINFYNRLRK